jgi:hypothetical protein
MNAPQTRMQAQPVLLLLAVLAAAVLAALASTALGGWTWIIPGLLGLLLVARFALGPKLSGRLTLLFGALGAIVSVYSAMQAIVEVGSQAPYDQRAGLGWLALALAAAAGLASTQATTRPAAAGTTMLVTSTAGFIAINLFYINTFYSLGVLLLWAGAVAAFTSK